MELHPNESSLAPASLSWSAQTDVGLHRQLNEDAFYVIPEMSLFVVSDGMGGHQGGEIASNMVAQELPVMIEAEIHRARSEKPRTIRRILEKSISTQNKYLRMEGFSESGKREMGATLVFLMIRSSRAYVGNLGDSRCYRMRKGKLTQVTKDHSVVAELIEEGRIEPHEADDHEAQGQITNYIGMKDKPQPHIKSFLLKPKDRILLCSDGLTDMLTDNVIRNILEKQADSDKACKQLIEEAKKAGGHDNITTIIIDYKR